MNGRQGLEVVASRTAMRVAQGIRPAVLILLSTLVLSPLFMTGAMASVTWQKDEWLTSLLAQERLDGGDEFGCYGFVGLTWEANPPDVAAACRSYLVNMTPASRWSDDPVSIYTPPSLTQHEHRTISELGFAVHGDNTGLETTAWHDSEDSPETVEDWYNLGRRGGSIEAVVSDLDNVIEEASEGGLLNFYWVGRVDNGIVRHDRDLEDWLIDSDAWFTTWGEVWSYWASIRCNYVAHSTIESDTAMLIEYQRPTACTVQDERVWPVPLTWVIELENGTVSEITTTDGSPLAEVDADEHILQQGWRQSGELLFLTISPYSEVKISFTEAIDGYDILPAAENYNNHSFAVTIAGHATENLLHWSMRFDDSPLRFTWLVIPQSSDSGAAWLPVVGVVVGVTSVGMTYALLQKEKRKLAIQNSELRDESE